MHHLTSFGLFVQQLECLKASLKPEYLNQKRRPIRFRMVACDKPPSSKRLTCPVGAECYPDRYLKINQLGSGPHANIHGVFTQAEQLERT